MTDDQGTTDSSIQMVIVSSGDVTSGGFMITGISPSSGQNLSYTDAYWLN